LTGFQRTFLQQIGNNNLATEGAEVVDNTINWTESSQVYTVHYHGGEIHRLPKDWLFPRTGVFDVWRQWWIGNSVCKLPTLHILGPRDFRFLNMIPLSEEETHGRTGRFKGSRRDSRKSWHDLKFLMEYIHERVIKRGAFKHEITPLLVDWMFWAVLGIFTAFERDAQICWSTVLLGLCRRICLQNRG
jgi:hypothetical protein